MSKDPDVDALRIQRLKRAFSRQGFSEKSQSRSSSVLVSSQSARQIHVATLTSPRERSEGRREYLNG